jgi:acid stress-induced BolA-like protein IbaG/YrbA
LNPLKVQVLASNDDPNGSHVNILCIAEEFTGKNTVQRQRLIYKAIWDELSGGPVHAVDSIVAKTPKEAGLS